MPYSRTALAFVPAMLLASIAWANSQLNPDSARQTGAGPGTGNESMIDVVDPILPDEVDYSPGPRGSFPTDTFVNSQGRRLLYQFNIPAGINLSEKQGVLIYFHGNNSGSQQQLLDWFFPGVGYRADEHGLIPIAAASPETRIPPQEEVRQWYSEQDALLLHEFLQEGLDKHFTVDESAIYFAGGSQGTCFLHDFMQAYGEYYGGGFYGGCGCYNSPDPTWDPPTSFKENMQVLINSSTDDFLLEPSHVGYAYYKYTIGLDTRKDLDREGPHCAYHWSGLDLALDWFLDEQPIPEEPFQPHWERISSEDQIVGVSADGAGQAWMALNEPDTNQTRFVQSTDRGATWTQTGMLNGTIWRFGGNQDSLFVIHDGEVKRSGDGATSFSSIEPASNSGGLAVDGSGTVYRSGVGGLFWSENDGDNWQEFNGSGNLRVNDTVAGVDPPRVILTTPTWNLTVASPADGSVEAVSDTSSGQPEAMTWDGEALWAIAPHNGFNYRLYKSINAGESWQEIPLPSAMAVQQNYYLFGTQLTALGAGRIIIHGGYSSAWLTENSGQSWIRLPGLGTAYDASVTARGSMILATDGEAVFRLKMSNIEGLIFRDRFTNK